MHHFEFRDRGRQGSVHARALARSLDHDAREVYVSVHVDADVHVQWRQRRDRGGSIDDRFMIDGSSRGRRFLHSVDLCHMAQMMATVIAFELWYYRSAECLLELGL